jgi:surfeit locus 1 family protein
MRLRFRFRTIPFIATVLLIVLGVQLGNWQTRRAAEKTALLARVKGRIDGPPLVLGSATVDAAAAEFRHVIVRGEFVPTWPVYLDNRPYGGASGFNVLMPFRIAGSGRYVLVERGWVPRGATHDAAPQAATPVGEVRIDGIAVRRPERVLQLGTPAPLKPGAIVQNLALQDFGRASGLDLQPIMIAQLGPDIGAGRLTPGLGVMRNWMLPGIDANRHTGYAFQWYALAAMAGLFFLMTGFRSGTRQAA